MAQRLNGSMAQKVALVRQSDQLTASAAPLHCLCGAPAALITERMH